MAPADRIPPSRFVVGLLIVCGGAVRADERPTPLPPPGVRPASPSPASESESDAAVDRLFADLTSDRFEVREKARGALAGIAARIRPRLEARREDPDPEVRRVAISLLASLGVSTEVAAPSGSLGTEGDVTLTARGTLAEMLARFDDVAVGRVLLPPSVLATPAAVDAKDRPWFEVLGTILDAARLDVGDGFDDAGQAQAVSKGATSVSPVACTGPFRLDVESVSTTKMLRVPSASRVLLGLRLLWAPTVQVVSYSAPVVISATDPAGLRLVGSEPGHVVFGVGGARRLATLSVGLELAPDTRSDRLDRLEVEVRIRIRRTRGLATIPLGESDVFPLRRPFEFPADAVALRGAGDATLESFAPEPGRPGWWSGVVSANLPVGVEPASASASVEAGDGQLRPLLEYSTRITGAGGAVQMSVRAYGLAPEVRPRAIRVTAYAREEEVPVRFVFREVPLR